MSKFVGKLLLYGCMQLFVLCDAHAFDLEESTGIVCDQKDQLVRYFTLMREGKRALQIVNTEAKANVCVIATVAYIKGASAARLDAPRGHFNIVEILVAAFFHEKAWFELKPAIQYTAFFEEEETA